MHCDNGETVGYTYDKLKRLILANSSVSGQQSYSYDGFGNMTYKSGSFSMQADPATNRLTNLPYPGHYDANGNMYQGNWSYDVENRLASVDAAGGEHYMYDPSNKRVYKQTSSGETYFFYGLDGKVMGEYAVYWPGGVNGGMVLNRTTESGYFGGKKVVPSMARDRLGSVRASGSPANRPYGENYSGSNTDGFGTYYQDSSTGLNYADQRYYNATYGRFNTPDRYMTGSKGADPGSWNRYSYVQSDPVNFSDATGRERDDSSDPPAVYSGSATWCDLMLSGVLPGAVSACGNYIAFDGAAPLHLARTAGGIGELFAYTLYGDGGIDIGAINWDNIFALAPSPTGGPVTLQELYKLLTANPALVLLAASLFGPTQPDDAAQHLPPNASRCPDAAHFNDPTQAPHPGWVWRGGKGSQPGDDRGAWVSPSGSESLHPDLNHPPGKDPHWDYRDPLGTFWECDQNGNIKIRINQ